MAVIFDFVLGALRLSDAGSGGTVTSVAVAMPTGEYDVTGSPITSSGTIAFSYKSQNQNLVFASPNGSAGTPSFRALVSADLSINTIYSANDTITSNTRAVSLFGNTSSQYLDFLTNAGSNLLRLRGDSKIAFLTSTFATENITWGTAGVGASQRYNMIDGESLSYYDFVGTKLASFNGQVTQRSLTLYRATGGGAGVTLTTAGDTKGQIYLDGDDALIDCRASSTSASVRTVAGSLESRTEWKNSAGTMKAYISAYGQFSFGNPHVGTALFEIYGATANDTANALLVADSAATAIIKVVNDGRIVQALKSSVITDSFLFSASVNLYRNGNYLQGRYKDDVGTAGDLVIGNMVIASNETITGVKTFNDGSLKLNGATSGASTLKAPAVASTYVHTLPAATTTIVGTDATQTLTNKRITARVGSTTSSATPTINTDNVDFYELTAQTVDITSFTTNLSGTPTNAQTLHIAITGTAARAITWGASFEASTTALPTTTVSTNRLDVLFVWNAATSKWRCLASA
ncbi:hypothetical protein KA025_02525 [Candidatus Saccharibacteria bacterium]|nr:hypothetical protein [Candidatus Saccharibacteria bacterium]